MYYKQEKFMPKFSKRYSSHHQWLRGNDEREGRERGENGGEQADEEEGDERRKPGEA